MKREKIPEHGERATTYCRNAKAESKQYELLDSKVPGLELRVNSKGKEWSLRYRVKVGEKWGNKRLPLGEFPTVTVANARAEAQQAKTDISRGGDPMGTRQKEAEQREADIQAKQLEIASRVTVNEAFDRWIKSEKPRNRADAGKAILALATNNFLPLLGHKQMKDVTRADILSVTDHMLTRGVDRAAQTQLADIKQFFGFAVAREIIDLNPASNIRVTEVGKNPESRERALSLKEIRDLDLALYASSLNRVTHIIYMLQIALTCRINELCQASWSDFDFDMREWRIPRERAKNRNPITVALSPYSISLLNELHTLTGHTNWIWPGRNGTRPIGKKQASNHARDRQLPEGVGRVKNRTIQTRSLVLEGGKWQTHDLRRTGATLMQMLGVPVEVSERCLNHVERDRTRKTYHRYDYDREMRRAWHLLSEALSVITSPDGFRFLQDVKEDQRREVEDEVGLISLVKQYTAKNRLPAKQPLFVVLEHD